MGAKWLAGVYGEKLVTAELDKLKDAPFLDSHRFRMRLAPHFFFLKPVDGATQLAPFSFAPLDYGLKAIAYEPIPLGRHKRCLPTFGGLAIPAKGRISGESFAVDNVPRWITKILLEQQEKVCVLSLISMPDGRSRTGTFFRYRIEGSSLFFMPLRNRNDGRYLIGKGVLSGEWLRPHTRLAGGMFKEEYELEKHCLLTAGGSFFRKKDTDFYISYRSMSTDLRMDLPLALMVVKEEKGFRKMAGTFGASVGYSMGKHLEVMELRNVLADGNVVDFSERKPDFDIRESEDGLQYLVYSVFRLLYACATAYNYGKGGLQRLFEGREFPENQKAAIAICYHLLRKDFLKGVSNGNLKYFESLNVRDFSVLLAKIRSE